MRFKHHSQNNVRLCGWGASENCAEGPIFGQTQQAARFAASCQRDLRPLPNGHLRRPTILPLPGCTASCCSVSHHAESLFESGVSTSYAATVVSILPSVEVLSRRASVWCLPNACRHKSGMLLHPYLSYQLVDIAYSNRLYERSTIG